MDQVGIETAQNVVVDHEVASISNRALAYIIDGLIIGAWLFVCLFIVIAALDGEPGPGFFVALTIIVLPALFYHLVMEVTMDGQSIGKRAQQVRVVRMDGGQPTVGQYLLRWLLRPIDGFYYLGLVVILINGKGQRLGDLAAGTTVVSLKPRIRLHETLMYHVPADHAVRFPEAVRLSDAQARLVKDVLLKNRGANRGAIILEMAQKVRDAIGSDGQGLSDEGFLEAVLRDYVHLTSAQGDPTNR